MHIGLNESKRILNHYLGPALTFIPPSLLHLWLTCFILGMHTLYNDLAQDCAGLIGICRRDHGNCMNVTQWRGSLPLSDAGVGRSVGSCAHYAHCIGKPACAFHLHSECDTLLFFSFQASRCQNYCWPVLWDGGQEGLLWGNKLSCSFVTDLADMNLKYQRYMNKVLNARVLF